MNFLATRAGLSVGVTTTLQVHALGSSPDELARAAAACDVQIDNRGGADAFVLFGGLDVGFGAQLGLRVPAGAILLYGKANATHIAVIGSAATTLVVHLGEGV